MMFRDATEEIKTPSLRKVLRNFFLRYYLPLFVLATLLILLIVNVYPPASITDGHSSPLTMPPASTTAAN